MQSFSMHNSFIKRLYSTQEDEGQSEGDEDEIKVSEASVGLIEQVTMEEQDDKDRVRNEIDRRGTFSGYKYRRVWCQNWFDKSYCCCCRPKRDRKDFLFKDAKTKLNEEVDILEIVKKLRVH